MLHISRCIVTLHKDMGLCGKSIIAQYLVILSIAWLCLEGPSQHWCKVFYNILNPMHN